MAMQCCRRVAELANKLRRDCTTPPAVWSTSQTRFFCAAVGCGLLTHLTYTCNGWLQGSVDYTDHTLTAVTMTMVGVAAIACMLVELIKPGLAKEIVSVVVIFGAMTALQLDAANRADNMSREGTTAVWRAFSTFAPICLQWRLGPCLVYGNLALLRDLGVVALKAHMHGDDLRAFSNLLLQIVILFCYVPFTTAARNMYKTELELLCERQASKKLLNMTCDSVVSVDDHHVICSDGLDQLIGQNMVGRTLSECLASDEEWQRTRSAFDTVRSMHESFLLPTTFCIDGSCVPVDLLLANFSDAQGSFLVGVRSLGERLPKPISGSCSFSIEARPTESHPEDSYSEMYASVVATEDLFGSVGVQQGAAAIAALGHREHWLIDTSCLCWDSSKVIGQGGFASVSTASFYKATVAVKTPSAPQAGADPSNLDSNSLIELRLLRHVRHPNIVSFLGASFDRNSFGIALILEYISGGITLSNYVEAIDYGEINANTKSSLLRSMKDVSCALLYLHDFKPPLLHKDVKGNNVLVELLHMDVRAKLSDFGLSHYFGKDQQGGTVNFMAPEALLRKSATTSVDVFAFGRLMYLVGTGKKPLRNMTASQIKESAKSGVCPSLDWPESLPFSGSRSLSQACMRFHPGERPDMGRIIDEIDKWHGDIEGEIQFGSSEDTSGDVSLAFRRAESLRHKPREARNNSRRAELIHL
eukprot:TRINITY_DN65088_c0_g1_i1.p1 TRINITY_DN65088_c0_g1~~TRINITY_DN65088_c0_g1_i1.p1  ORF type:complete len:715 (+),score=60.99 TRINITY_DN65088_c0_g1_i1:44-2146(+)